MNEEMVDDNKEVKNRLRLERIASHKGWTVEQVIRDETNSDWVSCTFIAMVFSLVCSSVLVSEYQWAATFVGSSFNKLPPSLVGAFLKLLPLEIPLWILFIGVYFVFLKRLFNYLLSATR